MQKLYTIGQASAMIDIPIKTIRYYESIGLCCPSLTDDSSGYRYYSIDDIFRLDLVRCLGRQLGMPLAQIRNYFDEGCSVELLKKHLVAQARETDRQIEELIRRKSFLSEKLYAIIQRENTPPLTPELISRPKREIAVISGSADNLEDGMLYARSVISKHSNGLAKNLYFIYDRLTGTFGQGDPAHFQVGLDADCAMGLEPMNLPAGEYLRIHYYNKDNQWSAAISALKDFMEKQGLQRCGPVINGGSLIDMSSALSKDYYFSIEFLVNLTN